MYTSMLCILLKRNKGLIKCHLSVFLEVFLIMLIHITDLYKSNFEDERNLSYLIKSITQFH
jgi:hypothetical protein